MKKTSKEKRLPAISLYLAIMVLALLSSLVLTVTNVVVFQTKYLKKRGYSITAYFAAETGIEKGLYDLTPVQKQTLGNGASFSTEFFCPRGVDCPPGFRVDSSCQADHFCTRSVGEYKGTRRAIEVSY